MRSARVGLLHCSLLLALSLAGASDAAQKRDLSPAEMVERLQQGAASTRRGNPETAIREYLQPVLDQLQRQYRGEKRRIFSANTLTESIMYAGLGAATGKKGKRDVLVLNGLWAATLYQKAYALVELERFDDAQRSLEVLLKLAPFHSSGWSELGAIHQTKRRWEPALEAYRQAEESTQFMDKDGDAAPEYRRQLSRAWRGQGFVLIETGKLDDAEALYRRCLELDPQDTGAKQELAYIRGLRH